MKREHYVVLVLQAPVKLTGEGLNSQTDTRVPNRRTRKPPPHPIPLEDSLKQPAFNGFICFRPRPPGSTRNLLERGPEKGTYFRELPF